MARVNISLGDFTSSVSQEALASHSRLITDTSVPLQEYEVRTPVRPENLVQFLSWIEGQAEINITTANISDFMLLSGEFGSFELTARCNLFSSSTVPVSVSNFPNYNQQIEATLNRIGRLEERVSSSQRQLRNDCEASLAQMRSEWDNQTRLLVARIEVVEGSVSLLRREFEGRITDSSSRITGLNNIVQVLKDLLHVVEFPLMEAESTDGVISYLTRKHEGNVHDRGIVTITSKSGYVCNVADLTSNSYFCSWNEPGQWICWDFHEMRVRPTHYTISCDYLQSWVVESSLEGEAWTEIDRKWSNNDFREGFATASFAVSNSAECRLIRLTQTCPNHVRCHFLAIQAFEFFGTLLEQRE
jgi:hypothetical protein